MKRSIKFVNILFICFSSLLLIQCGNTQTFQNRHQIKKGVLDLRGTEITSETIIPLKGEWNFYWESLVSGMEPGEEHTNIVVAVPGDWVNAPTSTPQALFAAQQGEST